MAEDSVLGISDSNNIKRIADAVEKSNEASGTATGAVSKTDELLTVLVEKMDRSYDEQVHQGEKLEDLKNETEQKPDEEKQEGWFLSMIAFARWGKKNKERDAKLEKMKQGTTFKFVKGLYDGVKKTALNILDLLMKGLGLWALWKLFSWIEEGGWEEYYENIKATIKGALETLKFVSLLKFIDWVKFMMKEEGPFNKFITTLKTWHKDLMKNKIVQNIVKWFNKFIGKDGLLGKMFGWIKKLPGVAKFAGIFKNVLKIFGRFLWPITFLWGAWETISAGFSAFEAETGNLPQKILAGIGGAAKGFLDFFIFGFADMIQDLIAWLVGFINPDWGTAIGEFDLVGKIRDGVFLMIDYITEMFSFRDTSKLGIFTSLVDIVFAPLGLVMNFLKGMFGWGDPDEPWTLVGAVMDGWKALSDWFMNKLSFQVGDQSIEGFSNLSTYMGEKWDAVATAVTETISSVITSIKDTFFQMITGIKDWFSKMFKFDSFSDSLASMINVLTFIPNIIKDALAGITTWLLELFGFDDAAKKVANANKFSIGEMVMNALKAVGDFIAGLFDFDFGAIAKGVVDSLPNMVKMMIPDSWLEGLAKSMDTDVEKEATKKSMATGGPVQAMGIHKVNEQGMEMFMPLMPGKIIPAKETATMMGGGGAPPIISAPVNNVSANTGSTSMLMPSSSTDKSNWKYGMQGA